MNTIRLNTIGILSGGGNAGGGGGGVTINNQEKSVEITENGTIEVFADAGFTGLGKITINVNVPTGTPTYENGVYVQHIDGKLYTTDEWTVKGFANDEANGVAVVTDKAKFVVAKNDLGKMAWSSNTSSAIDDIVLTSESDTALLDFAGYSNTQSMLATDTSGAGYSCANFTFPNGDKGYLPALGELNEAYANKSAIDSLMAKIGGAKLQSDYYWSSTQHSYSKSWRLPWGYGGTSTSNKSNTGVCVRAFSALPL